MSLLNLTNGYEQLAKGYSLNSLVSQFSGVMLVDKIGNITTDAKYYLDDHAITYNRVETSAVGPRIVQEIHRAWALPGYILETVQNPNIDPGIILPTLPAGAVSTVPRDIVLITTIPKYWYPEVPDGDQLESYDLRFDLPFLDVKNNRQLFKVAQNNILDNGVIVLQLSNFPAANITTSFNEGARFSVGGL